MKIIWFFCSLVVLLSLQVDRIKADYCTGGSIGTAECPNFPDKSGWYCSGTSSGTSSGPPCSSHTSQTACESVRPTNTNDITCGSGPVQCVGCQWVVTAPTPPPSSGPPPSSPPGGGGQCGTGCGCYSLGGGSCPSNRPTNLGVNVGECSGGQSLCCESGPCSGGGNGGGGNSTPSCNGATNVRVSVNGGAWTPNDVTIDWGDMLGFGGSASGGQNLSVWPKHGAQTCSSYPGYGNPCPNFVFITGSFWDPQPGTTGNFTVESWVPQGAWWAGAGSSCPDYLNVTIRACPVPPAPTLLAPANGSSASTSIVDLSWTPIADSAWGCANANRSYRVYVSTNPATLTTPVATITQPIGNPDPNFSYLGARGQTYYWRVRAVNASGGESAPSATWSFTIPNLPWWQVRGAGVTAVGAVSSVVAPPSRFVIDPPGVVVAGSGSSNFESQPVSTTNWLVSNAESDLSSSVINNSGYDDLERNILGYLTPTPVTSSTISNVNELLVGTPVNGVRYVMITGDVNLASSGPLDLTTNKIVLLVRGNVTISNTISLTDNQGFFLLGASGNISIANTVGNVTAVDPTTSVAHFEGLMLSGGTFYSGNGTRQLRIDGTVSAANVVLERSVASQFPGEFFSFRPEMSVYMPRETLKRNLSFEEVAP